MCGGNAVKDLKNKVAMWAIAVSCMAIIGALIIMKKRVVNANAKAAHYEAQAKEYKAQHNQTLQELVGCVASYHEIYDVTMNVIAELQLCQMK